MSLRQCMEAEESFAEEPTARCTCFEDEHGPDCNEHGCCGQCKGSQVKASEQCPEQWKDFYGYVRCRLPAGHEGPHGPSENSALSLRKATGDDLCSYCKNPVREHDMSGECPPRKASDEPKQRCLAMINEFGDKICSLPESHGGPHVWVTPEKSK